MFPISRMSRSLKVFVLGIVLPMLLIIGSFLFVHLPSARASAALSPKAPTSSAFPTASATSSPITTPSPTPIIIPRDAVAMGPYIVKGNTIVGKDGKRYFFHGIGRDGLEYTCWGDGHFYPNELAYMGSGKNTAHATYWNANTVRLPLSEGIWLNGQPLQQCPADQYHQLVKRTVDALTAMKLNVIIDLQWSDAGRQSKLGGGQWAMPDADSITFWQQVAGIYKSYPNVLFELFNEPHPAQWSCWMAGCKVINDQTSSNDCQCIKTLSYQSVGMQALVDTVRKTGAQNLALVGGMNWGFDLSQLSKYALKGTNIVYDTHPYPYTDKLPQTWDAAFGNVSQHYPVISAESGAYDCGTNYMNQLLSYFDAHQISWVAWSWVLQGNTCGYPQLIQDYTGTPAMAMGQFIYQRLHSYQ